MSAEIELAVALAAAAFGSFVLLTTSGARGGYLVQPRRFPGQGGLVGDGSDGGKLQVDQGGPPPPMDFPPPKEPEPPKEIPPCIWTMILEPLLAETAAEAEPYVILRQQLPWPAVNTGQWNLGAPEVAKDLPVGSLGYYVTGVVLHTLLQQGVNPHDFAQGHIFFPGCIIPAGALIPGTTLGKLATIYKESA